MKPGSGAVVRHPAVAAATGMVGKPMASLVGSTRLRSLFAPRRVGYRLGGGRILCITHRRKWYRSAFTVCVCCTGFARWLPWRLLLLVKLCFGSFVGWLMPPL